ncbi:MAG TPA: FecR domain-containing protein [Gemmatimonadaceae bacterium]|nr:FecR domain-containing protein [Gemmatimonadaceae bacterium]
MTLHTPSDEQLARYFAGEATADDRATVEAWARANDAQRAELDRLRRAWEHRTQRRAWNVDRAWSSVAARMDDKVIPLRPRAPSRARFLLPLAASLVLFAGITFAWRPWAGSPLASTQVHATAAGVRLDLELPDGSSVTLGPASELRVLAGFGGSERRVQLSGEAWFEVKHDDSRPFEVLAGTTITRDIGTSFSVRAFPGDSVVRVVLIEGSASLRHSDLQPAEGVTLTANDVGIMRATARVATVQRNADAARLVAWRTGSLDFDNTAMRDIATELARWYGVVVRFADSAVAARRYSGPVPTNDLAEAQRSIETALGVRIVRTGDTLVVR